VIDSHTHLASCAEPDAALVAEAAQLGVTRILTVGMDRASRRAALEAAHAHDGVRAAIGTHPNLAKGFDDAELEDLHELAQDPRCAAIGETGLDFFRERATAADQQRAFEAQCELARSTGKPLVIHSRAAEQPTIDTLRAHAHGLEVVLHCFSMPDRLEECLDEGWWISLAGNVTYPSNAALAEAAARVPDDRLLVETDAPYLTPQAVRKERNRPAHVTLTAEFVAERRGQTYGELEAVVDANAAKLFGW
jgi:TatD DNase family protein